jgi:CBS domain containing-hemolysin-like protein
MKLLFILALLVFVKSVLFYKAYRLLPFTELKRRARGKNKQISNIYKVVCYGASLDLLLWLFAVIGGAGMILIAANISWWLAVLVMLFIAWLCVWMPTPKQGGWIWSYATIGAPFVATFLSFLQPVLAKPAGLFNSFKLNVHTGLYEKEDLLELINAQNGQLDNRIPESDLKIAFGSLTFGDKKVGDVMTPRRQVKFVAATETIGPILMDELHKSGFSRFPVINENSKSLAPEIIGTLYIKDLIGNEDAGKVRDLMKRDVYFINEAQNLRQALNAFLQTQHHLLVVVNNFEEIVGVLSIEDVLEQIINKPIVDEFDRYHDLRAVAELDAQKEQTHHEAVKEPAQSDESVVE